MEVMDDINIMAYGESTEANDRVLEKLHGECAVQVELHGVRDHKMCVLLVSPYEL